MIERSAPMTGDQGSSRVPRRMVVWKVRAITSSPTGGSLAASTYSDFIVLVLELF